MGAQKGCFSMGKRVPCGAQRALQPGSCLSNAQGLRLLFLAGPPGAVHLQTPRAPPTAPRSRCPNAEPGLLRGWLLMPRSPRPECSQAPAGGSGTPSAESRETLCSTERSESFREGGERLRKGGSREGRQSRAPCRSPCPVAEPPSFPARPGRASRVLSACVFLPPPQQGRSLRLNLSAGFTIHHKPDRQAKFTSNAVNPLQTERLS